MSKNFQQACVKTAFYVSRGRVWEKLIFWSTKTRLSLFEVEDKPENGSDQHFHMQRKCPPQPCGVQNTTRCFSNGSCTFTDRLHKFSSSQYGLSTWHTAFFRAGSTQFTEMSVTCLRQITFFYPVRSVQCRLILGSDRCYMQ